MGTEWRAKRGDPGTKTGCKKRDKGSYVIDILTPRKRRLICYMLPSIFSLSKGSSYNSTLATHLSSVAAVQSCFCFIIVAAAIVLGIGALFLLFVLLYSQRVASQSCETLGELLYHPLNFQRKQKKLPQDCKWHLRPYLVTS